MEHLLLQFFNTSVLITLMVELERLILLACVFCEQRLDVSLESFLVIFTLGGEVLAHIHLTSGSGIARSVARKRRWCDVKCVCLLILRKYRCDAQCARRSRGALACRSNLINNINAPTVFLLFTVTMVS